MFKRFFLTLFLLCACAGAAWAQTPTTECGTAVSTPQVKSPFKIGFCWTGRDTDGDPLTLTAVRVAFNGGASTALPVPAPIGAPDASGQSYYEIGPFTQARTTGLVAQVTLLAIDQNADPASITFDVVLGKPANPTKLRVKR